MKMRLKKEAKIEKISEKGKEKMGKNTCNRKINSL